MKIAVEGCAHGQLEAIYDTIKGIEKTEKIKVDLLICCGDFQSTRNLDDLQTMAVPKKYQDICTFYKYYSGELVAPILTIFIGGNHEASNYLQELPYGGWVAPNIYYLGYAGVIKVNGIRIGGLSGIYKNHDYYRGRYEFSPYTQQSVRSVYHVRHLELFRLKQLSGPIDIFLSHDWPRGIYNFGNCAQLLRFKPHFREDIDSNKLGNPHTEDLLLQLKPKYWFAGHMHCKFSAVVRHHCDEDADCDPDDNVTKFLALDKCLPRKRFLQVVDVPTHDDDRNDSDGNDIVLEYDLEWLTILNLTNNLLSVRNSNYYMPDKKWQSTGGTDKERCNYTPLDEEKEYTKAKFSNDLRIPKNFCRTVMPHNPNTDFNHATRQQPKPLMNPQSIEFCDKLGMDDPLALAMLIDGQELNYSTTLESSDLGTTLEESTISAASFRSRESPSASSPLKRLSLPKPIATPPETTSTTATACLPSAKNSDEICLSGDDNSCHNSEEDTKEDVVKPSPPKVFKRRNVDIYKQVEVEVEAEGEGNVADV